MLTGFAGKRAHQGGGHRDSGRRTILGNGAFRNVDVEIDFLIEVRGQIEQLRPRPNITHRRLRGFLHHIAELSGDLKLALARHLENFDREQIAASFSKGEPIHQADFGVLFGFLVAILMRPEKLDQLFRIDQHLRLFFRFLGPDPRGFAANRTNLALETSHTGLFREVADHVLYGGLRDLDLGLIEPMARNLLGNEMADCDLRLFLFGVTRERYHLETIQQRPRDRVLRVGRRDEHHVREVVFHLEIVVREKPVLFRIQNLEKGAGRIAAKIGAHLVDLIEQNDRVDRFRLLHRLNNFSGQRADVSPAVTADFRLIPHAAKGNLDKVPADGSRDGTGKRGLTDARGPDQAQDRSLNFFDQSFARRDAR